MSLIAWYPLNGDTKDYSGNNLHLTNNEATVDVNGKIGSCYLTNQSNKQYLNVTSSIITDALSNGNDFTVCFWQKVNSCQYAVMNISCGNTSATDRMLHIGMRSANVVSMGFYGDDLNGTFSFSPDKWYHITAVYEKGYQKIYVNGKLINSRKSTNYLIVNGRFNIGSYSNTTTTAFYNDVRIYNEALTTKQIKEISQAKICHYTFNEELYENTVNLYNNKNQIGSNGPKIEWENTYAFKFEIQENTTYAGVVFNSDLTLKPLTTYTLSYKFKKIEGSLTQIRGHVETGYFDLLSTKLNGKENYYHYHNGIELNDSFDTHYIEVTFRTKEDVTSMNKIYIQPNAKKNEYVKVRVWDVQVEEKDHATPFTTSSRSQVLKDISGYGYDMNTYNEYSPIWNQDNSNNKIKGYSTLLNKASYYYNNFKYKYLDAFTFSCWVKTTDNEAFCLIGFPHGNNASISLAINNSGRISLHSYFSTPNANNDKWYAGSTTAINDDKWHLVTVTYDGTTAKSYIDGKYEASSTITFDFTREPVKDLAINMISSNLGGVETRRFEGSISDVRVYATALSAEDIKLLYQPEISIDKANVIRCSEINERNKVITESIEIVSAGYGANQNTYKVSIGNRYTTTIRATGWGVTEIDKDNNISYKTFATHSTSNNFNNLKTHVSNIPSTSTILLSTYDQPAASPTASNNTNCMNWINYLKSIGSTKLSGDFAYRSSYAAVIQGGRVLEEVIDNSGMDSKIILNTNIKLEISQNGFNKDASISFKEFNEIPEIKSGIHNLKLGDQILPVLVDMDNDGGRWARVFYHNCKEGTVLFNSKNSFAEAKETNINAPTTSDKYSILSKLESFRPNINSSFEFKLKYPTDTNGSNIWKQTSNPTYQKVTGYKPIKIDWTSNYWGGLEYSGYSSFIDGSVNVGNWYYAIGAANKHGDGIPSCTNVNNNGTTVNDVELWVRINNYDLFVNSFIDNVSISKDGVLTASEFREI